MAQYTPQAQSIQAPLTEDEMRAVANSHWAIQWEDDTGYLQCPGGHLHTTPNGKKDCRVTLDQVPTIHCVHSSCSDAVSAANFTLRSALGKRSGGHPVPQQPQARVKPVAGQVALNTQPIPLPAPLPNGFATMLSLAFLPDEFVAIAQNELGDDMQLHPTAGIARTRSVWEQALREKEGQNYRVISCKGNQDGLYIRVNPVKRGGSKNEDVTVFRHLLVEFDKDLSGAVIPKEVQFGILTRSGLPITTITDSANKSLHAWVRVDARDATEYKERAEQVYAMFAEYGVDKANKNPSRLSRCPGGLRDINGDIRVQHLLATQLGPKNWAEYQAQQQVAMVGDAVSISELIEYDVENDPNSVLGKRWLCKGGTVMFVGQAGTGKSSLNMQLSIGWALNEPTISFGINAGRPLKILIIQAENDRGDMAEMVQGVVKALGLTAKDIAALSENLIIYRDATHSGDEFLAVLESLIRIHKPDVAWIDPLLNYIGDDISEQRVCTGFTNKMNAIGIETGCILSVVHHTGKPKTDAARTTSDLAYSGLGSSVLTNWAREVVSLARIPAPDGWPRTFELTMTKRGYRAGLKRLDATPTDRITICHNPKRDGGICWLQCPAPPAPEAEEKPKGGWKKQGSNYSTKK